MCRQLAYAGSQRVSLHELLFGAPHSLSKQARCPRYQTSGRTNPDGWGVAWYRPGSDLPERHRTVTPIWNDTDFAYRSQPIESTAVLAAARLASPGAALVETGNAPFVSGPWSFSLNGVVDGFRDGVDDALRAAISPARLAGIEGDSDTEVLFALVLDQLDAGQPPEVALAGVVEQVTAITSGRFNLLLTDGRHVAATRYGNSLFALGTLLASEPIDDRPAWREIADESLVAIDADTRVTTSL